ncbi:DUF5980 family protein [Actinosynnema sp. NPDC023658]|uniref:DUF5980 family protein n=1 Tax=Actinosynnema sp. NPDC023658 TaxID=3155465 RepID=UPI0033FC44D7
MTSRIARSVLIPVSALLLSLVGSSVAASAQAAPQTRTWQLQHFQPAQRMCVQYGPEGRTHQSYLIFAVTGDWSTDLDFGMRDLPPGWTATASHLPPGSNHPDPDDGSVMVNGFIGVQGSATVPLATYHAKIWVSDGTVTETEPADIVVTTASWVDCMQARG